MSVACALITKDRKARAFKDGVSDKAADVGDMPSALADDTDTPAILRLTQEGAQALRKVEGEVICKKAGAELATDLAKARWRKEKGVAIAESGCFAYSFTPAHDGWRLSGCSMLRTARMDLRSYLHIFGDFGHVSNRGTLPDFYLRDLTPEEIEESGLSEGAVLSVSSSVMKKLGRFHARKAKKREKRILALLREWSAPGGTRQCKLSAKHAKNAWVISLVKKRG